MTCDLDLENNKPKISIITATYNRPEGLKRVINTLQKQTYRNFEHIIVDDGAIYDVKSIIDIYGDERVKYVQHQKNKGYLHAKNSGLENISGEWFTILDDDDELYPEALETLLDVPRKIDPRITAVNCNCIDTSTKKFSGYGVEKDQFLDIKTIVQKLSGEHWGITHTSLLGTNRFNPKLKSDGSLWYKINLIANRYYIHKALRIFHTEGKDRTTLINKKLNLNQRYEIAKERLNELEQLMLLRKYKRKQFKKVCVSGILYSRIEGDKKVSEKYTELLKESSYSHIKLKLIEITPSIILIAITSFINLKNKLKL